MSLSSERPHVQSVPQTRKGPSTGGGNTGDVLIPGAPSSCFPSSCSKTGNARNTLRSWKMYIRECRAGGERQQACSQMSSEAWDEMVALQQTSRRGQAEGDKEEEIRQAYSKQSSESTFGWGWHATTGWRAETEHDYFEQARAELEWEMERRATERKQDRPAEEAGKQGLKCKCYPTTKKGNKRKWKQDMGWSTTLPWKWKRVLNDEDDWGQAAPLSAAKHIAPPHEGEPERREGDIVSVVDSEGQWKMNAACMVASTRQALRNKSMVNQQSQVLKSYGFEKRLKDITENHRQRNGSNCGAQRVCL